MTISNKKQLTTGTATRTWGRQIFAMRKSAVKCQMSHVKCSLGGFTLVETLIAIAILLIAVVGPISLIGDSLHKLYYARDQMVAINLAQEGIEAVRQKRDSDMLAVVTPGLFVSGTSYYIVDASSATNPLPSVVGNANQPVYLKGGFYEQGDTNSASSTQFTRLVTIASVTAGSELNVTSKVEWRTGGSATGTITVSENLFKWTP